MADAFDRLVSRVLDPIAVAQPRAAQPFESPIAPRLADGLFETHVETEAASTKTSSEPMAKAPARPIAFDGRRSPSPHPTIAAPVQPRIGETTERHGETSRAEEATHVATVTSQSTTEAPSTPVPMRDSTPVEPAVAPLVNPAPSARAALRRATAPPAPTHRSDPDAASDRSDPVVRITIGRLEVRADIAAPIAPPTRSRPERRVMPLEEYLERRAEGTRP